jgi:hypothetical protein
MSHQRRPIDEVIDRISEMQTLDLDRLDKVEFVADLQEEFGIETVHQAVRMIKGRGERAKVDQPKARPDAADPLWDRDLDG